LPLRNFPSRSKERRKTPTTLSSHLLPPHLGPPSAKDAKSAQQSS